MADKEKVEYTIEKAIALYPRLVEPTKWVNGKRVDCDIYAEGAHYSMNLILNKEQAVPLYKVMKQTYEEGKEKAWPDFPKSSEVFSAGENDGEFIITTKVPAAYGTSPTTVVQFDSDNNKLPEKFLLTTKSVVNVNVDIIVYNPSNIPGSGVTLRLRQVQVYELAELMARSKFSKVEGGFNSKSEGFRTSLSTPADTADISEAEFDDPTPKTKPVEDFEEPKAKVKAEPKKETKDVGDFDDIDKALENLEFDD